MPSITVRNVPDEVHRALRLRAARHGRSASDKNFAVFERARDKTPARLIRDNPAS